MASLFRNFLLADRVLRSLGCTPASIPRLPPGTSQHALWQSWDLAAETSIANFIGLRIPQSMPPAGVGGITLGDSTGLGLGPIPMPAPVSATARAGAGGHDHHHAAPVDTGQAGGTSGVMPPAGSAAGGGGSGAAGGGRAGAGVSAAPRLAVTTPFFAEQLTAFEVWLDFGANQIGRDPPQQLPVVLQVLLSQAHRLRALLLLRRFFELGPWAVNLALSVGIFPYVLKLLQSPAPDLRQVLVCIWAKILAFDRTCQADLVNNNAHLNFITHLSLDSVHPGSSRRWLGGVGSGGVGRVTSLVGRVGRVG